jgi:hypothetical protein
MSKIFFVSWLLVLSTAQAEEIRCPDRYPSNEATLSEVPAGHQGSGLVRGAKLSSAYIHVGQLHADPNGFEAMQLVPKRVKGGWDTDDAFSPGETKWLVCVYGGDGRLSVDNPRVTGSVEWWERIGTNVSQCALHFREVKRTNRAPSDWTAAAACK